MNTMQRLLTNNALTNNALTKTALLAFSAYISLSTTLPAKPWQASQQDSESVRQAPTLLIPGEHGVGHYVNDFEVRDIRGGVSQLHQDSKRGLTVIAMTSTTCPISKKYLPTLVELHHEFANRGVRFILVNCISADKIDDMKEAANRFDSTIEYVFDKDSILSTHVGATSTTDVLLLDASNTVLYHGAIDDQYGFGYSLEMPRARYLRDAITTALDGRTVLVSATAAPGCALDLPSAETLSVDTRNTEITYHQQIARLMQRHCVECHREGGVGPFRLDTFDDTVAHAPMIRQVIERGVMPPWFAAPTSGHVRSPWINDRSLADSEKRMIIDWIESKMPAGDPSHSPLPRMFADGWLIGKPDAVFEFPKPIPVKASGTMPYQNIVVDTGLEEDRWVQAIEVRPGDPSVVHHVLVFVQGTDQTDSSQGDDADERSGYWGIYVPGNSTLVYPDGYAKRIPKGAKLRFQMHYTPNGTATQDSTRIGLIYSKEDPRYEVRVAGVVNPRFQIPPGAENHPVVGSIKNIPSDVQILGFLPHMHLRGKAARFELISKDQSKVLLDIPRYDFNWQLLYRYAEPLMVPAGSTVQFTAWYDNSRSNPANPDPTKEVRWGQQTFDEMHLGYVEYIVPGSKLGDRNPLNPRNRVRGALRDALTRGAANRPNIGNAMFLQIDANGDGLVTRDEVKAKYPNNPAASTTIFDRLDADKNDMLSKEEFSKLAEVLGR